MNKQEAIDEFIEDLKKFTSFYSKPERQKYQKLIKEWYENEPYTSYKNIQ